MASDGYNGRGIREFIALCEDVGLTLNPGPDGKLHVDVPTWKVDPLIEKEITQREGEILQFFRDLDENAGLPVQVHPNDRKIMIARR